MQALVSIAAVAFLGIDTQIRQEKIQTTAVTRLPPEAAGINAPEVKFVLVLGTLILLSAMSQFGVMSANLDTKVVPDNIFTAKHLKPVSEGEEVGVADLQFLDSSGASPTSGNFIILKKFEVEKVSVQRVVPSFKYEKSESKSDEDIVEDWATGSMILVGLGLATSIATLSTSKEGKGRTFKIFASFMALTIGFAVPF